MIYCKLLNKNHIYHFCDPEGEPFDMISLLKLLPDTLETLPYCLKPTNLEEVKALPKSLKRFVIESNEDNNFLDFLPPHCNDLSILVASPNELESTSVLPSTLTHLSISGDERLENNDSTWFDCIHRSHLPHLMAYYGNIHSPLQFHLLPPSLTEMTLTPGKEITYLYLSHSS